MLLKPDVKLERIVDISPRLLRRLGVTHLILDVDNTMSTHHGEVLTEGLPEWFREMKQNGITLTVLSNSKEKRVAPFARKIDLPYISLGLKPLPFGFWRAMKAMGSTRHNTAIVGDQIFTDVLGGNLVGVTSILLTPILPETSLRFRFKRKLERVVFKWYHIENTEETE